MNGELANMQHQSTRLSEIVHVKFRWKEQKAHGESYCM